MARNTNGKGFSLKDHLFNKEKVQYLAGLFTVADTSFNEKAFVAEVMKDMLTLELKQRIVCIAKALESQLPQDFKKACAIIILALPDPLDPLKTDDDFGSFIFAPLGEYVVRNGQIQENLQISLQTLREITMRFSMEDAIRYFINTFEKQTLAEMATWVHDDNYHVRRLVSEGTRPLLPWSGRLNIRFDVPVPFLHALHTDSTRYVTRSVANHMNDISKVEPDKVVKMLQEWQKLALQDETELDWMVRHSLRTLLKQGHPGALNLLGYQTNPQIAVAHFALSKNAQKVVPGDTIDFSFELTSARDQKLMIDYVIGFMKANGQVKPKVFKLKKMELKKGETITLKKSHRLLANATTFVLYPGEHTVTLQINGKQLDSAQFILKQ